MSKKTIGILLIVVGVIITLVSLFADYIGLGTDSGIHWAQSLGALIGVAASIGGVWLVLSSPTTKK
jgi:hypothetical protein